MKVLDFDYIRNLNIPAQQVYEWCNDVWKMKEDCILPPKTKTWQGQSGRYVTMPCIIPDLDIAGVKFISRNVDDAMGVPARNSHIMIQQCSKLGLLAVTDGMWITNMRTGAIAAHSAIAFSKSEFHVMSMMGLGLTARAFMYIFGNMYQKPLKIRLLRYKDQAEQFIARFEKDFPQFTWEIVDDINDLCGNCDTLVSAVSFARTNFVDDNIFKPGTTIVPIHLAGFLNCDLSFDRILIDDHGHVHEFKYYEQFKPKAVEMSAIATGKAVGRENDEQRITAYCGGIALHDIYFAYKIYQIAVERGDAPGVDMHFPETRFWI